MKIRFQTFEDIAKIFLSLVFFFILFVLIFLWIAKIELVAKAKGRVMPKRWTDVVSKASGFIKEIRVKEGDKVKKGDLLIRLENEERKKDVENTRLEIERLSLEKERLRKDLEVMKAFWKNKKREAKAGLSLSLANLERIKKGAKEEEIELAKAEVDKANIELIEAKRRYEKKKEEYTHKIIPQRELEEEEFKLKEQEANLILSQKNFSLIKNKYSEEDYKIAKAETERARAQLKEIKNEALKEEGLKKKILEIEKEIKKRENELLFLEKAFKELEIYSQAEGTILTRDTEQLIGRFIKEGDIVLKIGEQREYIVKAEVLEIKRPKVKIGHRAKIFVKAFPWGEYKIFNGKVTNVSQDVVKDGSYEVSIAVFKPYVIREKKTYFLKPGYEVEANIIIERDRIIKILLKELKRIRGEISPKNISF
ncbi:MAG: HlyD family efflux transporter periplasmic adaptor subunit [bacterium]